MRIGIYGYGNLGRGVEKGLALNPDLELVGVFTRRDPASVKTVSGSFASSTCTETRCSPTVTIGTSPSASTGLSRSSHSAAANTSSTALR